MLQLSFAFSDAKGNRPKGISTWRPTIEAEYEFQTLGINGSGMWVFGFEGLKGFRLPSSDKIRDSGSEGV